MAAKIAGRRIHEEKTCCRVRGKGEMLNPNRLLSFSNSEVSASEDSPGCSVKNKHPDTEEDMDADQQEVKRLKFSKDEEEEDDDEEEEEEQEVEAMRPSHIACISKEAEAMVQEEEKVDYSKENEASTSALTSEDQGKTGISASQGFETLV